MVLLYTIVGFIAFGITMEVFWSGILDSIKTKNPKLTGQTYLWMFPIYGIAPFIYILLLPYLGGVSMWINGIIYMIGFYILEFTAGFIIKKIVGVSPWDYTQHRIKLFGKRYQTHIMGLVCLEYAPIRYLYGVFGQIYFLFLMNLN